MQLSEIDAYIQANGHALVAPPFCESGVSGSNDFKNRQAFFDMYKFLALHPNVTGVLIYKLQDLARDAFTQEFLINKLDEMEMQLICVKETASPDDKQRRADYRRFIRTMSRYENEFLVRRRIGGKVRKARQGGWNGGHVPYGYVALAGGLVINQEEAVIVQLIFRLRDSGSSLHDIANYLNNAGVPGPKSKKNPDGSRWNHGTVWYILKNGIYHGIVQFQNVEVSMPELAILTSREDFSR